MRLVLEVKGQIQVSSFQRHVRIVLVAFLGSQMDSCSFATSQGFFHDYLSHADMINKIDIFLVSGGNKVFGVFHKVTFILP